MHGHPPALGCLPARPRGCAEEGEPASRRSGKVMLESPLEGCTESCQKRGGPYPSVRWNSMCQGPETHLGEQGRFLSCTQETMRGKEAGSEQPRALCHTKRLTSGERGLQRARDRPVARPGLVFRAVMLLAGWGGRTEGRDRRQEAHLRAITIVQGRQRRFRTRAGQGDREEGAGLESSGPLIPGAADAILS